MVRVATSPGQGLAGILAAYANTTTRGTGSFAGGLNDSVTLQYTGNGQFIVIAYANNSGSFTIL